MSLDNASDDQVAFVADRVDVEEAARLLWRTEHALAADALVEVQSSGQPPSALPRRGGWMPRSSSRGPPACRGRRSVVRQAAA